MIMNKKRIEQIMEKVTKRNLANVLCGNKTSEVDNEILELLNEVTRLTNSWNELRQHIKEYLEEWENSDDEWLDGKCDMARDILYDMEEIKESNK